MRENCKKRLILNTSFVVEALCIPPSSQGSRISFINKEKNPDSQIPLFSGRSFKLSLATLFLIASFPVCSEILILSPDTTTPIKPSCENGKCTFDLSVNPPTDITTIQIEQLAGKSHQDYIVKFPGSGFTINNDDDNSGISLQAHVENKFSAQFEGDLTINKTGELFSSDAAIAINPEGDAGKYSFNGNLTINLGSSDKKILVSKKTGAINASGGDFTVDGKTTISVQNLTNRKSNANLNFRALFLGGGGELKTTTERTYQLKDIEISQILATGKSDIVVDTSKQNPDALIAGIFVDSWSYNAEDFQDEKLFFIRRKVSADNVVINSVSLKAENDYPANVIGILNLDGEMTFNGDLAITNISVEAQTKACSYGLSVEGAGLGYVLAKKSVTIDGVKAQGDSSFATGIQVYPGVVNVKGDLSITGIEAKENYSLYAVNDSETEEAIITAENASIVEGDVLAIREPSYATGKGSEINLDFVGKVKVMVDGEEKEINKYLKAFSEVDESSTFDLYLANGAYWEVVTSNPNKYQGKSSYESVVSALTLDGGKVYVGSTAKGWEDGLKFADSLASLTDTDKPVQLTIKDLSGNGEFYLRTNADDVSDSIVITNSITGNFTLNIQPTGEEPPERQEHSYLAKALNGATGDKFTLGGGKDVDGVQLIDIGVYNYKLENSDRKQDGSTEWYLVRTDKPKEPDVPAVDPDVPPITPDAPDTPQLPVYSPTAEAVLAMAGMGAQSGFYQNQLTDVRKRLGEIRGGVRDGLWASVAGQKDRVSGFAGTHFKQDVYRFNFGADAVVGDWILGGNFKYINADQKTRDTFFKAKGEAHSEGLNLYATWQNEKGCYADFILSADRYHQRINNTMLDGTGVKGTYRNLGLGVSAEIGKKFSLNEAQTWFAEPQLQLSYYHVKGDDFTMSNGMTVKQGNFNSLTGRVGVAVGHEVRTADGKPKGQVYLRTGLKHEFLGKQTLHVNDVKFRDKLVGTRAYYGLATDWNLTKNLKVYGHVERENGSHYTKEIEVMAGVKYSF